jgi:hypothetical protein
MKAMMSAFPLVSRISRKHEKKPARCPESLVTPAEGTDSVRSSFGDLDDAARSRSSKPAPPKNFAPKPATSLAFSFALLSG